MYEGLRGLIATVKEIAGTVNTDHQASLSNSGQWGATKEALEKLARVVDGLEALIGATRQAMDDRIGILESTCTVTA